MKFNEFRVTITCFVGFLQKSITEALVKSFCLKVDFFNDFFEKLQVRVSVETSKRLSFSLLGKCASMVAYAEMVSVLDAANWSTSILKLFFS